MPFSHRQQPEFRVLVAAAWREVCKREGLAEKDARLKNLWYRDELLEATGKHSTKACNPGRDCEDACAHFERLGPGDSFKWQLRQLDGDRRRIEHEVRQMVDQRAPVAPDFEAREEYLRGIASQALGFRFTGELGQLQEEQLLVILRALKIQLKRQYRRGDRTDRVRTVEEPF